MVRCPVDGCGKYSRTWGGLGIHTRRIHPILFKEVQALRLRFRYKGPFPWLVWVAAVRLGLSTMKYGDLFE